MGVETFVSDARKRIITAMRTGMQLPAITRDISAGE